MFLLTLAVGNLFVAPDKALSLRSAGYDFLAFYTAGTFVREGRTAQLYDLPAVQAFQQSVARAGAFELPPDAIGPFWNPPFYAWPFVPLSALPYPTAWAAWMCVNLLAAAVAIVLLCRMLPAGCTWRERALVPLLVAVSAPFVQAVAHGQNTCVSLLLLTLTATFWRQGRGLAAGATLGLLFYKPQLALVASIVLVLTLGWRAVLGLAITGSSLLLVNLVTLPGTLGDYLSRMPGIVRFMQVDRPYLWDRHVTLKAFWRFALQGHDVGEAWPVTQGLGLASTAVVALALLLVLAKRRAALQWHGHPAHAPSHDATTATAVIATPLLMPFYFDYDLLLLAVPATLFAGEWIGVTHRTTLDRLRLAAWVALFAWLFVNPHAARLVPINGAVVVLTALFALTVTAAMRSRPAQDDHSDLSDAGAAPTRASDRPLPLAA